jgi:hypothetical protein
MGSLNKFGVLGVAILAVLHAPEFSAATFRVPTDARLLQHAEAVVTAKVMDVRENGFRTLNTVLVQRVLKGPLQVGESVRIAEYGGSADGIRLIVAGVPTYDAGKDVLLFLTRNRDGEWTTDGLAIGKFEFVADRQFGMLLLREEKSICGWTTEGAAYRPSVRRAESFLDFLERSMNGEAPSAEYFLPESSHIEARGPRNESGPPYKASDFLLPGGPRWPNFDVPRIFLTNESQIGVASSVDAVDLAAALWTDEPNSTVHYIRGGVTAATSAFRAPDGENTVLFNDPSEEVCKHDDPDGSQCDFVIGMAAIWTNDRHQFGGEMLDSIVEADVVITYGTVLDSNSFAHLIAHELGHTLGLRHSTEPSSGPVSADALMFPTTGPDSFAVLRPWDQLAIATVYGSGTGQPCEGPRFLVQPPAVSVAAGGQARLDAKVEGSFPMNVQWFRGESGVTSDPVPNAKSTPLNLDDVRSGGSYWMRAKNDCGIVNSTSAQIQITSPRGRAVRRP